MTVGKARKLVSPTKANQDFYEKAMPPSLFDVECSRPHPRPGRFCPRTGKCCVHSLHIYSRGHKAGYESSTRNADGSLQVHFEFNDRGRGPNINEKIVVGKDGIPTDIEITGVDYLKAPVDERFSLKEGVANWKNRSEQGQKKIAGK